MELAAQFMYLCTHCNTSGTVPATMYLSDHPRHWTTNRKDQ